jgi:hypothetical protein
MTIENNKSFNINRIAILYRDLLTSNIRRLSDEDKDLLLSLEPSNKIVAIGDIDASNWCAYPLTYMLSKKLVAPTVLDDSKIYQSWHAMRCNTKSIVHPQALISQVVVIKLLGYDNSPNINDYINSFINMCISSDDCKLIFVIADCTKKFYKDNIYIRKSNSTFIETSSGKPYTVESTPLCISPDQITFFNYSKTSVISTTKKIPNKKKCNLSSMINDSDMF